MKPKFIIDDHIPFIKGVFDKVADIDYLAAKEITPEVVKDADALIIRTRTKCDAALLDGCNVKLIVTATIGIDHIDTDYCDRHNIVWKNAPGCNARSVAQWMGSALSVWAKSHAFSLNGKTIGIVGHGHVGKEIEGIANMLGLKVLLNDPPLALKGHGGYVDMDTIARDCDIISFHTPLTFDGDFKTFHLADKGFFDSLKKRPFIINAARGGIIDEVELVNAIMSDKVCDCAIDCWEGEPDTNDFLRDHAIIATPHIAGYSADGKYNATEQSIKSIVDFFNVKPNISAPLSPKMTVRSTKDNLMDTLLESYPIMRDSDLLKSNPDIFEFHRGNYPIRREVELLVVD